MNSSVGVTREVVSDSLSANSKLSLSGSKIDIITNSINAITSLGQIRNDVNSQDSFTNLHIASDIGHSIGSFFPVIDSLVTAFDGIVKLFGGDDGPTIEQQLRPQFDELHRRFDSVDNQLKSIISILKRQAYDNLKDSVIIMASEKFRLMVQHPSSFNHVKIIKNST